MKKKVLFVLTLALIVAISGCGSKPSYSLDEIKLANDLISKAKFDTEMYQIASKRVDEFISSENAEKKILFMGNGTKSDAFGIFTLDNEEDADKTFTNVQAFLSDYQKSFEAYIPEEAKKVEQAVVILKGKYVVFCIAPKPETVQSLIESSFVEVEGDEDTSKKKSSEEKVKANTTSDSGDELAGDYPSIKSKDKVKEYGGIITIGNSGFELYSYVGDVADQYAKNINTASKKLKGISKVYNMVIPLSSGIVLPDKYYGKLNSSNQRKALDELYKKIDDNTVKVEIYDNLMKHRDKYVYYRTDHHWTALGAYYGYEVFCDQKGILPISLERHKKVKYKDFLGSFYNDTKKSKDLEKEPDTIVAYEPISSDISMEYTNAQGQKISWDIIHDVSQYPKSVKYSTFIGGDNPFTTIKNDNLKDGSSCLVVKESFGNSFVPFLVDHYEKVYVVDYRYWNGNIVKFAKEHKVDDVLFINNLSMTRNSYLTGKLGQVIQ